MGSKSFDGHQMVLNMALKLSQECTEAPENDTGCVCTKTPKKVSRKSSWKEVLQSTHLRESPVDVMGSSWFDLGVALENTVFILFYF